MLVAAAAIMALAVSSSSEEAGLSVATGPEISTPNALKLGWRVSCQHYTLRDRGLFEAIDALSGLGILNIEPTDFLKMKNDDETITNFRISAIKRSEWKKHLAERGMKMPTYYVSSKDDMTNRQLWDFMKEMGVEIMCGEPVPADLGMVEILSEEYGIKLAIHNHPEGHSIYWDPETTISMIAAQGDLGLAIGLCPDVGHWARSCVDVVKGLSKYHERPIYVLHVKDIPETCQGWKGDVPLGKGEIPFKSVLDVMSTWNWQGIITIELEAIPASLRDIGACAQHIENYARTKVVSIALAQKSLVKGQAGMIRGIVMDSTRIPLSGVTVEISAADFMSLRSVVTNDKGEFTFHTEPIGPSSEALRMRNQRWIELIKSKKSELEKAIDKTFKMMIATEEDTMMASVLLWDDGSIETHYRDYHPEDTSLSARSAIRIYRTISRSREDHKKIGTEEYVKHMMSEHRPNPDKIIHEAIKALLKFDE